MSKATPTTVYDPLGLMFIYPTPEQINSLAETVSSTAVGTVMQTFNKAVTQNTITAPICEALRAWYSTYSFPTIAKLPMSDPVDVAFCTVAYFAVLVVFYAIGRVTGKLELRGFGMVYNFFLVLLSGYMAISTSYSVVMSAIYSGVFGQTGPLAIWNVPVPTEANPWSFPCAISCWIFMMSKLVEYMDTYIMVLKHNYRQVTFLHLYHHSSIFIVAWVISTVAPGGDTYWSVSVNSGIHVVMYAYYLLNLIFTKGSSVRGFLQRNKFIITYGQLFQFVLNFLQTIYVLVLSGVASPSSFTAGYARIAAVLTTAGTSTTFWRDLLGVGDGVNHSIDATKQYPPLPMHINFWYMLTMLALFGNFLIKNRKASSSSGAASKKRVSRKQD